VAFTEFFSSGIFALGDAVAIETDEIANAELDARFLVSSPGQELDGGSHRLQSLDLAAWPYQKAVVVTRIHEVQPAGRPIEPGEDHRHVLVSRGRLVYELVRAVHSRRGST
jgi:hypothetical protein